MNVRSRAFLSRSVLCALLVSSAGACSSGASSDTASSTTGGARGGSAGATAGGVGGGAGGGGSASGGLGGNDAGTNAGGAGTGGNSVGHAGSAGANTDGQAGSAGSAGTGYVIPAYASDAASVSTELGTRNAGHEFTVAGEGIRVRDLGIFDSNADGLAAPHTVTLFALDKFGSGAKATAVSGGSVVVPAGKVAELDSGFRYAPLSAPVALAPGKYAVVAYDLNAKDLPGNGGGLPLPATGLSDASFDPFQFVTAASPAFPTGGDANQHANASLRFESRVKPLRIMPLGASITDGFQGTMAGYRGPLKVLLDANNVAFQYVGSSTDNPGTVPLAREQQHHEGHSGFVIQGGNSGRPGIYDSRLAWWGPAGSQADLFLIVIGTNDVDLNYQLDTASARLDALVASILDPVTGLQPKAKVILAQLPFINDAVEDQRCVTYNKAVVSVVKAHQLKGEAITTVDLHSVLTPSDKADNLHPNDAGYAKIAQVWLDAIRAL